MQDTMPTENGYKRNLSCMFWSFNLRNDALHIELDGDGDGDGDVTDDGDADDDDGDAVAITNLSH